MLRRAKVIPTLFPLVPSGGKANSNTVLWTQGPRQWYVPANNFGSSEYRPGIEARKKAPGRTGAPKTFHDNLTDEERRERRQRKGASAIEYIGRSETPKLATRTMEKVLSRVLTLNLLSN